MAEQRVGSVSENKQITWETKGISCYLWCIRKHMQRYAKRFVFAGLAVFMGLGTYTYVSSPTKVSVAIVKTVNTEETLGATGRIQGEKSVDLGLDVSGVVKNIYVEEGDFVRAGTLVLSLSKSDLDANVDASRAAVTSAQAELARVNRGPLPSEINRARAELAQAQSVGDAKIAQARARLKDLQAGSRSQEIAQAQAELQRQNALLKKAQNDLRRMKILVAQEAVAQSTLDDAQTSVDTARANVDAQKQQVSILKSGSRPSQIAEANAALTEAIASRDTQVRASREALNTLLSQPRREDVNAARAKVAEAQAELRRSMDTRDKPDLRAPFDGVIAQLPVEIGQSVSPGQKLVVFQQISKPIIEVETDEENLKMLNIGQKAVISSDAFPGRRFEAVLYDLGSKVDPDRGTITIKLRPAQNVSWLRPDLTVDVNIITKHNARRIILPPDTVTRANGKPCVLAVRDGHARPVAVTTGAAGPKGIVVIGELREGEMVVRDSAHVIPGDDVNPVTR